MVFSIRIHPIVARTNRGKVDEAGLGRIDRSKDVIVQRALVIVDVGCVWLGFEKLFGQPKHIVRIARFGSLAVFEQGPKTLRIVEVLGDAVATESNGAILGYRFPEETRASLRRRILTE